MISPAYRIFEVQMKAQALGLEIQEPGPCEIFLDLDDTQSQYVMEALLPVLKDNGFDVQIVEIRRSRNYNKHVILRAPRDLTPLERVCLQACLGSDRKRELLSFLALEVGAPYPSVLFRKPEEKLVF